MRRLVYFLPLIIMLVIAFYFLQQLYFGRDPALIPSALLNKPAPRIAMEGLDMRYSSGLGEDALMGDNHGLKPIKIVNFFASWCVPCRAEHPFLMELAKDASISMIGINYKDNHQAAVGFIDDLGNPYQFLLVDKQGRIAIEWGLYGVPETYIIDEKGIIRFKQTGPLVGEVVQTEFMQTLNALK